MEASVRRGEERALTSKRLRTIDALRGVAALAVVIHHVPHPQTSPLAILDAVLILPELGPLGVTLFLAISGFCIHLAARRTLSPRTGRTDWAAFWKRRIVRLYPPYLAAIALSLAIYYGTGGADYFFPPNRVTHPATDIALHVFMLHNLTSSYAYSLANGPFWSLGLEEQLYGMYAIYIALRARMSAVAVANVALWVSVLWRLVIVIPLLGVTWGPLGTWWTWPLSWWFSWIAGAVVGEVHEGTMTLPRWCRSRRLLGALVALAIVTYPNVVEYPPFHAIFAATPERQLVVRLVSQLSEPVFSVVFALGTLRALEWERSRATMPAFVRFASWLGGFSYSLYLVHLPLLFALSYRVPWLEGNDADRVVLRFVLLVPASVAVAYAFHRAVERHFMTARAMSKARRWHV